MVLPPVGRRPRNSYVVIELNKSERIGEVALQFAIANDSDEVRAELTRRWGKPRTSREHKCRLRGCVYGDKPMIVVREIDTRLTWSIRAISR